MRGLPRGSRAMATAVALTLALAACGGDDDNTDATKTTAPPATSATAGGSSTPTDTSSPGGSASATGEPTPSGTDAPTGAGEGKVTIAGCEAQNPLVPTNTNETCGGDVIDSMFTGLVNYNPTDAKPENAVAESIETEDNKTYTIKIKAGTKFHDGTDVKAKNFVDAWNYGAYGENAQANSYFFDPIEGFKDVAGEDTDGDGKLEVKPKAKELSGLKVVDDTTFTVTLAEPSSSFPQRLGYTAFSPMPDAFFADTKAFEKAPIGNGPFKLVKLDPKASVEMTNFEEYSLPDKGKVKDLVYKVYASEDAAYADLISDNIDVQTTIPVSALAGDKFREDLGDRITEQPSGSIATITIPEYVKELKNPDLRKAISLAIDRPTIVDTIFNKTRVVANGWVSPVVGGYKEGQCGEFCTFDEAKAKEYLQKAGGYTGTLTLGYNADSSHKDWTEAVCNSIKNVLEIKCQAKPYTTFAAFLKERGAKKMTGMYRTGWQMDYPAIENFLTPLYATGASANDSGYSNKEFDALVKKAATQSGDEALATYQQAEALLAKDMQVIPMWYGKVTAGHSKNVETIKYTPFGTPDISSITVKK